ncbi:MAG: hypothetical protein WCJ61_02065 [Paludibacter sp.]
MTNHHKKLVPMYDNKEDQEIFEKVYWSHYDYIEKVSGYFEKAGVDIDEEDLWEVFEDEVYPFEEFQHAEIPVTDMIIYGGEHPFEDDLKVFYLNIKYANLADKVDTYQMLKKYGVDMYPVYIIDTRSRRSLYVEALPDEETQTCLNKINNNELTENELLILKDGIRKFDLQPTIWKIMILDKDFETVMNSAQDTWVYVNPSYKDMLKIKDTNNNIIIS